MPTPSALRISFRHTRIVLRAERRARQQNGNLFFHRAMPHIDYAAGLLWYIVFLYSTVCHEAAHAWVALKLGDDTAYQGGQVTLDPIPHIRREPWGMVVVPLITFYMNALNGVTWMMGWASAPYNREWAERKPRSAAWMAIAGPAANLLLVIAAAICIRIGLAAGWFTPGSTRFAEIVRPVTEGGAAHFFTMLLGVIFSLNVLLMTFNLIPLPPFDGASVPLLFLRGAAAASWQQLMWNPAAQLMGFVVAFKGFGAVFYPIHTFALNLLYFGRATAG